MGMFDSVIVRCPNCNTEQVVQSKGGDCILAEYTLENAPLDVLTDINRHAPFRCGCGCEFAIQVKTICRSINTMNV